MLGREGREQPGLRQTITKTCRAICLHFPLEICIIAVGYLHISRKTRGVRSITFFIGSIRHVFASFLGCCRETSGPRCSCRCWSCLCPPPAFGLCRRFGQPLLHLGHEQFPQPGEFHFTECVASKPWQPQSSRYRDYSRIESEYRWSYFSARGCQSEQWAVVRRLLLRNDRHFEQRILHFRHGQR